MSENNEKELPEEVCQLISLNAPFDALILIGNSPCTHSQNESANYKENIKFHFIEESKKTRVKVRIREIIIENAEKRLIKQFANT